MQLLTLVITCRQQHFKVADARTDLLPRRPRERKHVRLNCEPMITTPLPEYPWQVVGSDLNYHIPISGRVFFHISRNLKTFYYHFTRDH